MNFIKSLFAKAWGFVTRAVSKVINTVSHLTFHFVDSVFGSDGPKLDAKILGRAALGLLVYVAFVWLLGAAAVLVTTGLTWVLAFIMPVLFANLIAFALSVVGVYALVHGSSDASVDDVYFPSFVLETPVAA